MRPNNPICFSLPDETETKLNLNYKPHYWPPLNKYEFGGGFTIQRPWIECREMEWYSYAKQVYDHLQHLLSPHAGKWVEAKCFAALVPDVSGEGFSVQINGLTVKNGIYEGERLRRRLQVQRQSNLVTICHALIFGGGETLGGGVRNYGVGLDMRRFRN